MVNGFRYYTALESVSVGASALSTALTIYPCQNSGQFTPMRLPVNTVIHTTLVGLEPTTPRSLVRRAGRTTRYQ